MTSLLIEGFLTFYQKSEEKEGCRYSPLWYSCTNLPVRLYNPLVLQTVVCLSCSSSSRWLRMHWIYIFMRHEYGIFKIHLTPLYQATKNLFLHPKISMVGLWVQVVTETDKLWERFRWMGRWTDWQILLFVIVQRNLKCSLIIIHSLKKQFTASKLATNKQCIIFSFYYNSQVSATVFIPVNPQYIKVSVF